MANLWFRLWHDTPHDPKWRTIARISKQSIPAVLAVYLHLLNSASQNVTRGHANVTIEDIASGLDMEESSVKAIYEAMQNRVLDGDYLTGWEKRQPKREDLGDSETGAKTAAERKRAQRDREKQKSLTTPPKTNPGTGHKKSRKVTLDKDKETDKEVKKLTEPLIESSDIGAPPSESPNSTESQGRRLSKEWVLPKSWGEWAIAELSGLTPEDVRREGEKFKDHWTAKAGKDARKADWKATWRNWIRSGLVKPSGTATAAGPWFLSSTKITAEAVKLGFDTTEQFPYLKARVFAAMNITDDMVRKAQSDLPIPKRA